MEVLAFTAGGDGVRASRIYCQTEQDGLIYANKLIKANFQLI